jgi:hypothetical protein
MTKNQVRILALFGYALIPLVCIFMSIQTGNYTLSEKWGYSGLLVIIFGIVLALAEALISDMFR